MNRQYIVPLLAVLAAASGCDAQNSGSNTLDYSPMAFSVQGTEIVARGTIDGTTLGRFIDVSERNPAVRTLVLQFVDGSVDDVANLVFSRRVRDAGFTTVVPANGMVASGGTDLFLAGKNRILEAGACIGVHSWSDGINEGKDVPQSDPQHQMYLRYYREMGVDENFYWFTLEAAPAQGLHWMNAGEAETYGMSTQQVRLLGTAGVCWDR